MILSGWLDYRSVYTSLPNIVAIHTVVDIPAVGCGWWGGSEECRKVVQVGVGGNRSALSS